MLLLDSPPPFTDETVFAETPVTVSFPLTPLQSIVLNIFKARGSLTDDELGIHYGLLWSTQGWPKAHPDSPRKRRSELTNLGLLVATDEKRMNSFGSLETIWAVQL